MNKVKAVQGSQARTCYPPSCGFALVVSRTQNRMQDCYNLLLLIFTFLTSLICTPYHALSAPLLIIAHFIFQADARNFKDGTTFFFHCCDMFKFCLPWSHSSRLIFFLSLTHNTSNCLQPAVSKCVCVRVCVCVFGRGWEGGRCLMTNLCMLILHVLMLVFKLNMKCMPLGFIWESALLLVLLLVVNITGKIDSN